MLLRLTSTTFLRIRFTQGCAINQSLSALGNVISALVDRLKNPGIVVPYRDSKLTHLLKNSLGGNAKTIMVAAIAPTVLDYDETLSTLRYVGNLLTEYLNSAFGAKHAAA